MGILTKKQSNTVSQRLFLCGQQACKHSSKNPKPLSFAFLKGTSIGLEGLYSKIEVTPFENVFLHK